MSELEKKVAELERRLSKYENQNIEIIPTYSFSKISYRQLEEIVDINEKFDIQRFNSWFNNNIMIDTNINEFLLKLIGENRSLMYDYDEEDLKLYFLAPLFNKINFKSFEQEFRAFYNEKIVYKTDNFILNGEADFLFAKGLKKSKIPYFFIQEFKKGKQNSDPQPQLLAEMIAGLEISKVKRFRGAYIIGAIWNFVILEKLDNNKYRYFISQNFDSTKIDDLTEIYKNLLFIKNEVITLNICCN